MDLTRPAFPVLRLFAFYQAAVAGVCAVGLAARPVLCAVLAAGHAAVAVLLLRGSSRAAPPGRRRHLALPYLLWLGCWLELGWIIRWTGQPLHDPGVAAADLAIFGGHGHLLLSHWLPGATLLMQAGYLSYYALILGPPLYLALRGRRADCRRYTVALMATYLTCFACYLVFPVLGPRAAAASPAPDDPATQAGLASLEELLRRLGDSPGTAFPSSHCAGAWTAALAAGRLTSGRVRGALLLWASLITVSTVHTGNHYGIDAVAGVSTAAAVRLTMIWIGTRRADPLRGEVIS